MQLTYNESRAICIQDPQRHGNALGPGPVPVKLPGSCRPGPSACPSSPIGEACLSAIPAFAALACGLQTGLYLGSRLMQQCQVVDLTAVHGVHGKIQPCRWLS